MKTFINRLLLFIIPTFLGISMIFLVDLPKNYAYHYTKNDGCNITWIHDRIFEDSRPLDLVFLGSSHTGCGINDKLIDELIPDMNVSNLSYCQGGRSIHYTVLKDILKVHNPQKVVLEVRMEEDFSSHRDFGVIGELGDVASAPVLGNTKFFRDLYRAFQTRYIFFQDNLMDLLPDVSPAKDQKLYSHVSIFKMKAPVEDLDKHLNWRMSQIENHSENLIRSWKLKYPLYYLEKISELCRENEIELIFLYIPSYGMAAEIPFNATKYEEFGRVLIPPSSYFKNVNFWMDTEHFNVKGSKKFSEWVAGELN